MRYEYKREAAASKRFGAKQLSGLPKDIELDFDNVHVRVYKSENQAGYFSCSLAIPAHEDDEGYVLEYDFSDPIKTRELDNPQEELIPSFESDFDFGEPSAWEYEAPLNDHSFDTLVQAMSGKFSDETEQGQRCLLFNLRISGTPFSGYALIYPDLYRVKA